MGRNKLLSLDTLTNIKVRKRFHAIKSIMKGLNSALPGYTFVSVGESVA